MQDTVWAKLFRYSQCGITLEPHRMGHIPRKGNKPELYGQIGCGYRDAKGHGRRT